MILIKHFAKASIQNISKMIYSGSRKNSKQKRGTPGWIVTFADMMALLLTFFIMMLSYSTTDSQKYKAVVESMEEAFGPGVGKDEKGLITKMQFMTGGKKADFQKPPIDNEINAELKTNPKTETETETENKKLNVFLNQAKKVLGPEISEGSVEIELKDSGILIRFPERVAFSSGSDELTENFDPVIGKLIQVLNDIPGKVSISGHTDDHPIDTFRFRSNWELSSSRAVSVLHAILNNSELHSHRFTVQGYADTRPLKPNTNTVNRAKNRRVEISIRNTVN